MGIEGAPRGAERPTASTPPVVPWIRSHGDTGPAGGPHVGDWTGDHPNVVCMLQRRSAQRDPASLVAPYPEDSCLITWAPWTSHFAT